LVAITWTGTLRKEDGNRNWFYIIDDKANTLSRRHKQTNKQTIKHKQYFTNSRVQLCQSKSWKIVVPEVEFLYY